jgi:hypothetical protein
MEDNTVIKTVFNQEFIDKFYEECTAYIGGVKKVTLSPHNMLEWLQDNIKKNGSKTK